MPLLEEGFTDHDLPAVAGTRPFRLQGRNGGHVKTFQDWSDETLEDFDLKQWWMLAPVFETENHYDLNDNTVLPFVPFEKSDRTQSKQGGYSEVFPVKIHPAHHDFWESPETTDKRLVAVKQLFSSDDVEFEKEVEVLKTLGHKHHPHLMRLLSTYRQKQKYHLMFPWADGNLRQFWESKPLPQFDKALVLWSLRQMTGIANALHCIHSFRVSHPLAIQLPGEKMLRKDVEMTVMRQDELFGRHGDIKPENILWLQGHAETEGDLGTLQIADFGSGRFHGRDSRSAGSSNLIFSTPTYEPPESRLNWPISRAYDIWSLGCLYLEFITWLLKGADAIDDFSNVRGQFENGIDNDDFFSISIDDAGRTQATLREGVVSWVDQLHTHEHCSALIHELLDMIMSEVLVINSKDRSPSFSLFQSLKSCLRKAECDASYMMEPVPRAPRRTSIGSISNLSSRSLVLRNGKDLVDRPFPKDLVGRNVHMRRHGSSSTWPPSTRLVANRPNTQS